MKCKLSYNQMIVSWLERNRRNLAESSTVKYKNLYDRHIEPFFRGVEADCVDQKLLDQYQKLLAEKTNAGGSRKLSGETIRSIFFLVKKGLGELPNGKNLSFDLRIRKQKRTIRIFSEAECRELELFLRSHHNGNTVAVLLCLYTGIRIGELCALKWGDLDWKEECISITRTVQRLKREEKTALVITAPKTNSSVRIIPLAKSLLPNLKSLYESSDQTSFIFSNTPKLPLDPRTMQYRYKRILEEAGIAYRNFHTLRHTFASRCITLGMDMKTLSELLGHANIQTTLNYYCHISMSHKKEQINLLNAFSQK